MWTVGHFLWSRTDSELVTILLSLTGCQLIPLCRLVFLKHHHAIFHGSHSLLVFRVKLIWNLLDIIKAALHEVLSFRIAGGCAALLICQELSNVVGALPTCRLHFIYTCMKQITDGSYASFELVDLTRMFRISYNNEESFDLFLCFNFLFWFINKADIVREKGYFHFELVQLLFIIHLIECRRHDCNDHIQSSYTGEEGRENEESVAESVLTPSKVFIEVSKFSQCK